MYENNFIFEWSTKHYKKEPSKIKKKTVSVKFLKKKEDKWVFDIKLMRKER